MLRLVDEQLADLQAPTDRDIVELQRLSQRLAQTPQTIDAVVVQRGTKRCRRSLRVLVELDPVVLSRPQKSSGTSGAAAQACLRGDQQTIIFQLLHGGDQLGQSFARTGPIV